MTPQFHQRPEQPQFSLEHQIAHLRNVWVSNGNYYVQQARQVQHPSLGHIAYAATGSPTKQQTVNYSSSPQNFNSETPHNASNQIPVQAQKALEAARAAVADAETINLSADDLLEQPVYIEQLADAVAQERQAEAASAQANIPETYYIPAEAEFEPVRPLLPMQNPVPSFLPTADITVDTEQSERLAAARQARDRSYEQEAA